MCGRYTLTDPDRVLAQHFEVEPPVGLAPRYNIAPTQEVAVVRGGDDGGGRELGFVEWGFVSPSRQGSESRLINARSETVANRPAFRRSFRQRRCLVPADGFFEWRRQGGIRQPFYFRLLEGQPFAFAGLWSVDDRRRTETCAILTTEANAVVAPVHHRMPVILDPGSYTLWLDRGIEDEEPLLPLLRPLQDIRMEGFPVDLAVNRVASDNLDCIRRVPEAPRNLELFE